MTTTVHFTQEEVEEIHEIAEEECTEACHPWIYAQVIEQFIHGVAMHAAIQAVHEHHVEEGIVNVGEYRFHVVDGWVV